MPSSTIRQYGDPVLKERTPRGRRDRRLGGRAWSSPCSRPCTPRRGPAWRRTRSACSGASSCTTSATGRRRSSTRGSSRVTGSGRTTRVASPSRASAGRSCAPNAVHLARPSTSTATLFSSRPTRAGRPVLQHELDHLDGILLVERLNEDQRKEALKILRSRTLDLAPVGSRRALEPLLALDPRCPGTGPPRRRLSYGDPRGPHRVPRHAADGGAPTPRPLSMPATRSCCASRGRTAGGAEAGLRPRVPSRRRPSTRHPREPRHEGPGGPPAPSSPSWWRSVASSPWPSSINCR